MSPFKRGAKWWLDVPASLSPTGKRLREPSEARTEREATLLEHERRIQGDRARKHLGPGSINPKKTKLLAAATRFAETRRSEGHRANTLHTVNKHVERSGLGELLLEHVTPTVIEDYLQKIERQEKASPGLQNRIRSMLSGTFKQAKKDRVWFGANPVTEVEQREESQGEERMIDPADILDILENAPTDDWRVVLALAAYAGLRRGEIRKLDLLDEKIVDFGARVITVLKSKNKTRHVGIHKDLLPILEAARKRGLVLSSKTWQKAHLVVKTALDDDDAVFHGLRHSWTSQLDECGARESVVEYMGWGRRSGTTRKKRYLHFPAARLVAEIDKLVWPSSDDEPQTQTGHHREERAS
jgi:integrase